ncbi:MAG: hypothetical protein SCH71_01140 [Desulfobulbaceae bacterium]|nr:hypothetical protein [Desulfobulbaceae bacterium]
MSEIIVRKNGKKQKGSLDYYLILATAAVLFVISVICIFGMFYFKFAFVHQLPAGEKLAYMNGMNAVISPFIVVLILLLGICVPKRLLPARPLNRFAAGLTITGAAVSVWQGIMAGLMVVLAASLLLQSIVLLMALAGSERLNFEKSGYWVRVGSSLIHLGLILFILDLLLYRHPVLHLFLFWVTTGACVLGMMFCFYSQAAAGVFRKIKGAGISRIGRRTGPSGSGPDADG